MSWNYIATPDLPSLLRLCSWLNQCAHLDPHTHTHCIPGTFGQFTVLGLFDQWVLAHLCSAKPPTCFLDKIATSDSDNTLLDLKLVCCKHWKCDHIQKQQMYRQLRAIAPTFLLEPSSSYKWLWSISAS